MSHGFGKVKVTSNVLYSAIGILALMVLLIENHDILWDRTGAFEKPAWRAYRRFLLAVLVYYLADAYWGVVESYRLQPLIFVNTSLYYTAIAAGVLCWTQYTIAYLEEDNAFGRFFTYAGRIVAALTVGHVVVNFFVPILFWVGEDASYHALSGRYAIFASQIALLLLLSGYAVFSIITHHNTAGMERRYQTLAGFGLIMAIFLLGQLLFMYVPFYSVAYMLGTCLLRAVVIGDEKEEYRRGMEEAKEVAELQQSINSLLDNMPALTFSKDIETGRYLACNQAFAEYARRETPAEVIGLTDFEIFEEPVAAHFVEDDRKAFAMDEPYVFYEDVADAAGDPRQFQTTKLKFYDTVGRSCLLGMSMDVTETERARKMATRDALTGVRNKHAYVDAEQQLNDQIEAHHVPDFAIVVCDINDLKTVNDTQGHMAGDAYIKRACATICEVFKHSPVFRVGGDEFAVISQGHDLAHMDELTAQLDAQNAANKPSGDLQIAYGVARFEGDRNTSAVFERADKRMYACKAQLKAAT